MNYKLIALTIALLCAAFGLEAAERQKLNFNDGWQLHIGDIASLEGWEGKKASPTGGGLEGAWQQVTLPYAFNGDEAFRKDIVDLTDTVCWYRKTFQAPLLSPEGEELMRDAFDTMGLSARSHDRILRVARTIADLDGAEEIGVEHIAEAIQYRSFDFTEA